MSAWCERCHSSCGSSVPRPSPTTSATVRLADSGTSWTSRATRVPGCRHTVPAIGRQLAGDDLHQRRLAGAIAADDRDALPGIDLERHIIEKRNVPVGVRDVFEGDERHAGLSEYRTGMRLDIRLRN